jgi:hypothetical protein
MISNKTNAQPLCLNRFGGESLNVASDYKLCFPREYETWLKTGFLISK